MLDVSIRLEMLNLLDDLRTRLHLALLYITHDIASARYFADEVLVMYAGQVVERGPAEEVTQVARAPLHPASHLFRARPGQPRLRAEVRQQRGPRREHRERASPHWLPVQHPVPPGETISAGPEPGTSPADRRARGGLLAAVRSRASTRWWRGLTPATPERIVNVDN